MTRIGIISDTHGLLRSHVPELFAGADQIIHAGDIGDPSILDALREIAPVTAVRGNVDVADWANSLREIELVQVGTIRLYVIHDLSRLNVVSGALGIRVVVHGHSHRPAIRDTGDVMYLNPGSAGPRRFSLAISCAMLEINGDQVQAKILSLE